ncbi:MAG: PKD domain-containing protein [Candidatus Kapaibacterium sp.]
MKTFIVLLILVCSSITSIIAQQSDALVIHKGTYVGTGLNQIWNNTYDLIKDDLGFVYICGVSTSFQTTFGVYQPNNAGNEDAFVCKLTPDLSSVVWSTYLGGSSGDCGYSISLTNVHEVIVTGFTRSVNFPLLSSQDVSLIQGSQGHGGKFICKLSSDGSQLLFSRIIGSAYDYTSIAINSQNEIFVFGEAYPGDQFEITSNAYQTTPNGLMDLHFTKLSPNGTTLYSTYIGGAGNDYCFYAGMCYANNKIYLTGKTYSANFPLASGKSPDALGDCFVMAWNDGTVPTPAGTYIFGGSGTDEGTNITFNQTTGKIIVCGTTTSNNMPYTTLLQSGNTSGGFIASINADFTGIDYLSIIGAGIRPGVVRSRPNGDVWCSSGTIGMAPIPLTAGAFSSTQVYPQCTIVTAVNTIGALKYGSYMSGTFYTYNYDRVNLAVREINNCTYHIILAGRGGTWPTTPSTYQPTTPGGLTSTVSIFRNSYRDTTKITATPTCGEYMFQGTSTGIAPCNAVNYFYNFGDGTAVVTGQQNVTHKYSKNGTFTVTYRVAYQGDTTYYEKTINVQSQPTIKASPNVMYYCTKQNGIQLSASGGVRYEWSPGAVFSDSTKQNPIAKPTKNMWLYVRGYDANGCFATDSVQVYVTSVTATASSDTIVCKGTSVTLNASGGAEVKWSPSTGLNKPTGKSVVATPTETTTYQVIVGDGDCKDTTHVTISVSNKPKVTLNPAPVICTGGNVQLGAALEGSYIDTLASTYLWTPTINLSNPNIKNPVATPTKTTRYKCTVTNKYGCTITDSVEVKVQNNLKVTLSADTSVCAGYGVLLKASGGANYTWYPPDYLDNPNSATPYCTPQKNITYKVITTSGTCIDSATMNVGVHPLPIVKAQGETTVCSGQPVQLSVQQAELNTTYTWRDSTGASIGAGLQVTVNPIVETRYYVTATTNNNCTAHDSVQVHISNVLNVQALGATTVCTGTPVQLSINTPDATATYEWTTNGNIIGTGTSITVTPTQTSTFVAHGKRGGCEGWDTVTVQVNNALAIVASVDTSICAGSVAMLKVNNPEPTINYTWSDEQNNVVGTSNAITVQPTQSQWYTVKGLRNGCDGVDTVRVVVQPLPSVTVRDTSICQGQTATVKVVNPDATNTYTWKDDKGNVVAQSTEYTTTPQTTSTYSVTVRSEDGCESSAQATITIVPKTTVHLFVAPIRDSIQIGDTIRVQVFAQSDRDVQLQQVEYDIQTETDVMDIPTSVHSGAWQTLHINTPVTLGTAPTQIYEFTGKALVTQTRQATLSIENLSTNLNPECRIQTSKGTTFITGTTCAINILKFRLTGTELLLSPNPSNGEVIITSDYEIEEIQVVNALGQTVTSPTSSPKERTSSPSPSERAGERLLVTLEANGLYFIRAKVHGEWITRSVVVQR